MLRPMFLLPLAALAGCTLLDQRSFEAAPQAPAADAAARATPPAHALLTLRLAEGQDWRPALREAVAAAQGRKPDVAFEVAAPVPLGPRHDQALGQASADTTEIANGLLALGVAPGRVHLALTGDAGDPPREVRLYAR